MANVGRLWAIVLAGDSGHRLEAFPGQRRHQYPIRDLCAIIGRRTILQHTWKRVEMVVPRERVITVIDVRHRGVFRNQLAGRTHATVIRQPANRETGPATLLPMAHVLRADPEAIVAIFPFDHFLVEEKRFMAHVEIAEWVVRRGLSNIVVLGVAPDRPDSGYGWIEVNRAGRHPQSCLLPIKRFWEKPRPRLARSLYEGGHLWSTMVTVARAASLWDLICAAQPALQRPFERIKDAIRTPAETDEIDRTYDHLPSVGLSSGVFERAPSRLAVLVVRQVHWSDWEHVDRARETLRWLANLHEHPRPLTAPPVTATLDSRAHS